MRYVMDGSPWSFISPFLDLYDTFKMRTTATSWNIAAKYPCGKLLFFLLHEEPHEDMSRGCRDRKTHLSREDKEKHTKNEEKHTKKTKKNTQNLSREDKEKHTTPSRKKNLQ